MGKDKRQKRKKSGVRIQKEKIKRQKTGGRK
jgi:hypothetical protein